MRVFASDAIKGLMGRFGIPEDEAIENKMVTRSLESAQQKIEGFNFDARKHVLEYDNVLDKQRRAVYERRRTTLMGRHEAIAALLQELAGEAPEARALLDKKEQELGLDTFLDAARQVMLQILDTLWVDHLESMEYLRGSVNLRAYGQRDPLVEYRKEGVRMYKEMEEEFKGRVFDMLDKLQPAPAGTPQGLAAATPVIPASAAAGPVGQAAATLESEMGRNDKVTITNGTETQELKYKKAEPLIKSGQWRLVP